MSSKRCHSESVTDVTGIAGAQSVDVACEYNTCLLRALLCQNNSCQDPFTAPLLGFCKKYSTSYTVLGRQNRASEHATASTVHKMPHMCFAKGRYLFGDGLSLML